MSAREEVKRLDELCRGLRATAPYLLSHHLEDDLDRCHRVAVGGREVHLCARCSGIWPGIAAAAGAVLAGIVPPTAPSTLVTVTVLPLFALVDWARTAGPGDRGSNPVRTATGFLLGVAAGLGYAALFAGAVAGAVAGTVVALEAAGAVIGIGVGYALAAAVLLRRNGFDSD